MWHGDEIIRLPQTKKKENFYITSNKGELYFIQPGACQKYDEKNNFFTDVNQKYRNLGKISKVFLSPGGSSSLHLPKDIPVLAFHQNSKQGYITTIPFPKKTRKEEDKNSHKNQDPQKVAYDTSTSIEVINYPNWEKALFTNPYFQMQYSTCSCKSDGKTSYSSTVKGLCISENGKAIALSYNDHLWVWQERSDQMPVTGFWTNLTPEDFAFKSNAVPMADQKYGTFNHGYNKPQQLFTLDNSNVAPNVSITTSIAYQDMAVFNNPDEGTGICCLTILLPPYKPFDLLYLYNSICYISGVNSNKTYFDKCDLTLSIVEHYGAPCVWWSPDCRFLVLAVSNSLIIMTRYLKIIKVLSLDDIFTTDNVCFKKNKEAEEKFIADVSWSCQNEFFVVTSFEGQLGIVTRCGKTFKHQLCALESFSLKHKGPLLVTADSLNPYLFNIYSPQSLILRQFIVDKKFVVRDLQTLISLPFPQISASKYWKITINQIQKIDVTDKMELLRLLYYTYLFRIFPYKSPLRFILLQKFEEGATCSLESGDDIFTYFLVRCIFRLTEHEPRAYSQIISMLSDSKKSIEKVLCKILIDEKNRVDFVNSLDYFDSYNPNSIQCFNIDTDLPSKKVQPPEGKNIDLNTLINFLNNVLYRNEFTNIETLNCNLSLLPDLLLCLDQPDKALNIVKYISNETDQLKYFVKILTYYSNDASKLYVALISCIKALPKQENELRAICLRAIINILKNKIALSIENLKRTNHKKERISKLATFERELQLIIPKSKEELNDFGVIFSIGLLAAGYTNCSYYCNKHSTQIPEHLRFAVSSLFKLLWFVQWRHQALFNRKSCDGLLRLIAFPEFVDSQIIKSKIKKDSQFSKDVFDLYSSKSPLIENDPLYPYFIDDCKEKLNFATFSSLSNRILEMTDICYEIQYSPLLNAAIISHLVPWLRCAIPRAMKEFHVNENVPKALIDFEQFQFYRQSQYSESYSEYSDYSPSVSYSEGEYKGETNNTIVFKSIDVNTIKNQPPKQFKKPRIKKQLKVEPQQEKKKPKRRKQKAKEAPIPMPNEKIQNNEDVFNDPISYAYQQIPYPIYYQVPQHPQIIREQEPEKEEPFLPIWDFSPDDFCPQPEEEEIKEEVIIDNPEADPICNVIVSYKSLFTQNANYVDASTQPDPPKMSISLTQVEEIHKPIPIVKHVKKSKRKKMQKPLLAIDKLELSSISSDSDFFIPTQYPKDEIHNDPFPLDDMLPKKFESILNELQEFPKPKRLPDKHLPLLKQKEVTIPSYRDFEIDRTKYEFHHCDYDVVIDGKNENTLRENSCLYTNELIGNELKPEFKTTKGNLASKRDTKQFKKQMKKQQQTVVMKEINLYQNET